MHRLFLLPILALALILNGCTPSYNTQLIRLASPVLRTTPTGLMLDNDTLTMTFNFYNERGLMRLTMVNKLPVPLYVDWKQSALILGQDKLDYWYDVSDVNLAGGGSSYSYGGRYSQYYRLGLSGTIVREDRVAFLPPRTKLTKQQFILVPQRTGLSLAGEFVAVNDPRAVNESGKTVPVHQYTFSPVTSPLTFRNYLTLSTDKDFKTQFHLDTEFHAAEVLVMPRAQLQGPLGGTKSQPDGFTHPLQAPDAFYVTWNSLN
jgi:hypothetical protein